MKVSILGEIEDLVKSQSGKLMSFNSRASEHPQHGARLSAIESLGETFLRLINVVSEYFSARRLILLRYSARLRPSQAQSKYTN
jgi:hypothetical protein